MCERYRVWHHNDGERVPNFRDGESRANPQSESLRFLHAIRAACSERASGYNSHISNNLLCCNSGAGTRQGGFNVEGHERPMRSCAKNIETFKRCLSELRSTGTLRFDAGLQKCSL